MASGVSNGHVTSDVTWPWKVTVVTHICLDANISKAVRYRGLVPIGNKIEIMAYGKSNGHVTNDVTWSRKVTIVIQYVWAHYIQNGCRYRLGYNTASRHVTGKVKVMAPMWPVADYLENSWRYTVSFDFMWAWNVFKSDRDSIGQIPLLSVYFEHYLVVLNN